MRPGLWQLIVVVLLIVVLFGAKKIPDLARSLGKAKGEFKKGLIEGEKEESAPDIPDSVGKAPEPVREIS